MAIMIKSRDKKLEPTANLHQNRALFTNNFLIFFTWVVIGLKKPTGQDFVTQIYLSIHCLKSPGLSAETKLLLGCYHTAGKILLLQIILCCGVVVAFPGLWDHNSILEGRVEG